MISQSKRYYKITKIIYYYPPKWCLFSWVIIEGVDCDTAPDIQEYFDSEKDANNRLLELKLSL